MPKTKVNSAIEKPWWQYVNLPQLESYSANTSIEGWAKISLYYRALEQNETMHTYSRSCPIIYSTEDECIKKLSLQSFSKVAFMPTSRGTDNYYGPVDFAEEENKEKSDMKKFHYHVFTRKDSCVSLSFSKNGESKVHLNSVLHTVNEKIYKDLHEELESVYDKPYVKHYVYVLAQSGDNLSLSTVGQESSIFEKDNYNDNVINDCDYILKELRKEKPAGRLVILNGLPGTGKTYLVRSFITSMPKGTFVIVPVHLVSQLGSPSFIKALIDYRDDNSFDPMYLILEDADQCLVPRAMDNMPEISGLLNLSDGILGSLLDLRVIATTNAKKMELDAALKRPGRLLKLINVDLLAPEKASKIYNRLTSKDKMYDSQTSLAQVYMDAREE